MPSTIQLPGRLSVPHVQIALDAVAARHEILRMHFVEVTPGKPSAYVTPAAKFVTPLEVVRVPRKDVGTAVSAEFSKEFDLNTGPLFRGVIIECTDDPNYSLFIANMHHTLGDGWSMGIMQRELADAYNAAVQGKIWEPSELPIQYFDYAVWQREYLASGVLQDRLAHWRRKFEGLPTEPVLKLHYPRTPEFQGWAGITITYFDPSLVAAVRDFASSHGLNMQAVMLCACGVSS